MILPNDSILQVEEMYNKAKCLFTKREVEEALDNMATAINNEINDERPIFLCVLVGGIVPLGNLLTRLSFPLELDYAYASRYAGNTTGSEIVWKIKPRAEMKGRTVVIVDDILDGGVTLATIRDYCIEQHAKKIYTAVLVDKQRPREVSNLQHADFTGLVVPDVWVVGYGLDYKEYMRNLPGIYVIAPQ